MDEQQHVCACGEIAHYECRDCQQPLCTEHTCSSCGRCEADCICHLLWWTPDLFI